MILLQVQTPSGWRPAGCALNRLTALTEDGAEYMPIRFKYV